ncbi:MAG: threonylcarbamoyl-AMP synthase [Candidatus Latescibacteria bacterium]|nr:threonylcarbamoyl-AMP synthase [Candidatus Latescibacterota bacterium]
MILDPTPGHIKQAVDCIKKGGLIAYPTETVYGLGVDPFNAQALARIFATKGRSAQKALIVLLRHKSDLSTLTSEIPPIAEKVMNTFWPGPLTLIFKANPKLPQELLGGRDTIALRHSSASIAQSLVETLGGPLTSTSANVSEQPPAQSAQEVHMQLGSHLDLIIDGGPSPQSQPSTILDISKDTPIILRTGMITKEELTPFVHK